MALDKAALLARKDLRRSLVDIGDGQVWMREFSVSERQQLSAKYKAADPDPAVAMHGSLSMVVVSLQNEDGTPMFAEAEVESGVKVLEAGSERTVAKLLAAMASLNGLGEGALKEALGKSEPTPSDPSSSG